MFETRRNHEELYEGVVIKLPLWFIEMNNLQNPLKELRGELSKAKKSVHHPDYQRTMNELENYPTKAKKAKERAAKKEADEKKSKQEFSAAADNRILQTSWEDRRMNFKFFDVRYAGVVWEEKDYKVGEVINPEFVENMKKLFNSDVFVFEDFCGENALDVLCDDYEKAPKECFKLSDNLLSINEDGGLTLHYKRQLVRYTSKKDKSSYSYNEHPINYDVEKKLYWIYGYYIDRVELTDYDFNGEIFTLKKSTK